ncbi:Cation/H(+) antiporter 15 [Apostasia shenzhenica]|uniref:Cation/H(+) antiporter 15 n=1 Tax=Apostasia shenzhenica TaxID=1088818 RepID=A0A2I0A7S7_9ASPA|nr:Cation/H(+) antiporter 15 [Apostasia shenzhenica]
MSNPLAAAAAAAAGTPARFGADDSVSDCPEDDIVLSAVMVLCLQCVILIVLSQVLYKVVFKHLAQPSVISQICTGLLVGPTVLGKIRLWQEQVFRPDSLNLMWPFAILGRLFFMLLVGLEMDVPFLRRSLRSASAVALGGGAASVLAAAVSFEIIYRTTGSGGDRLLFFFILALLYANTASPMVIRMCTELKLAASEVGRLAVSAALLNDLFCLLFVAVATAAVNRDRVRRSVGQKVASGMVALLVVCMAMWVLRPAVRWVNGRNQGRRHIGGVEFAALLSFMLVVAVVMETVGYNSTMACFLMGIVVPREGSTARTMVDKLSYPVDNFVLPIFFGYAAAQTDLSAINSKMAAPVVAMVTLGLAAKTVGTLAAVRYLGMQTYQGLAIGFLLNIKGHIDFILVSMARSTSIWGEDAQTVLLVTVLATTLTAGPAAALVVRIQRRALRYRGTALERQPPYSELRVLACLHGERDVPTLLNLLELCNGAAASGDPRIAVYLMHLVELTANSRNYMLYHQQDAVAAETGGWVHGGDAARHIAAAADLFSIETGIVLRQVTVVSALNTMQADVFNAAEDVRASMVVVPFHKHQRVDGRMMIGREGVRQVNDRVLQRAPCTVGVLIDRGLANRTNLYEVAVLFFGGADDREALALGVRLALHPCVSLTVIRFLPESMERYDACVEMEAEKDGEVLVAIAEHEKDRSADEGTLMEFRRRHVADGEATYMERYVENGAATVTAICGLENSFSLFLVGRGRSRRISPLTMGMSVWEECPELGAVGDLLASNDFMGAGSVLVVQQYVNRSSEDDDDEIDGDFM